MAGLLMRRDLAVQLDDHSQPQTFAANALSAEVCMTNINIEGPTESELWRTTMREENGSCST